MSGSVAVNLPDAFSRPLVSALGEWAPSANYTIIDRFDEGRSRACVLLVDIQSVSGATGAALAGRFILKIEEIAVWDGAAEPTEAERHNEAMHVSEAFARQHIPLLVRTWQDKSFTVVLYSIAGSSLVLYHNAYLADTSTQRDVAATLSYDLLDSWNSGYTFDASATPRSVLQHWLGYRLDPEKAPSLHRLVAEVTSDSPTWRAAGVLLPNPLSVQPEAGRATLGAFFGVIHGDLHPANLLVRKHAQPQAPDDFSSGLDFWLIDFALSRRAPLFFDHAYLEMAWLLQFRGAAGAQRMLNILDAADKSEIA